MNEEFDPDKVGSVSLAAKFLCLWVIAMEKYGKIYRYLLYYVLNIFIFSVPGQDRGEGVVPKPSSSFKILQQIGHCL